MYSIVSSSKILKPFFACRETFFLLHSLLEALVFRLESILKFQKLGYFMFLTWQYLASSNPLVIPNA